MTLTADVINHKLVLIRQNVATQFGNRVSVDFKKRGIETKGELITEIKDNELWLNINDGENVHSVTIPIPYVENGLVLLTKNDVTRAVCPYFMEQAQRELDYLEVIHYLICDNPGLILSKGLSKGYPFIQQIAYSIANRNTSLIVYRLQKAINEIVNRMPLHTTAMNTYVMNRRLMIVDEVFESLDNPEVKHEYQIDKARKYYNKGWTQMGLPDGTLIDKNYILKEDLKKFTPFGIQFHNPARNLYSTLGMRGDETPLITSESMQKLVDQGITRTGWNLFTVFADIPDVFEDQIMVDESHANKKITYKKRYQCFGTPLVKEGMTVKRGHRIAMAPDGQFDVFNEIVDRARVAKVTECTISVGGIPTKAYNIVISYDRKLKDGVKFTNRSANKGVIRMKHLGYAIDPRTGELRKIDVIVSSSAVKKRKNYAQLLEAMLNNVNGEKPVVLADKVNVTGKKIKQRLVNEGFPEDGAWMCHTYAGEFSAVCGSVFWGVIHDVEDMLWSEKDLIDVNGRGLRRAGLKFSTVEFRAIETRFGKNADILMDEIMGYSQGCDDLRQQLRIQQSKLGIISKDWPVVNYADAKEVDQTESVIVPETAIVGTVVDENFYPDGFMLELPAPYELIKNTDGVLVHEGIPGAMPFVEGKNNKIGSTYRVDKVYIPYANLRKSWRHGTGNYGLSEIGALVNNIVILSKKYVEDPNEANNIRNYYRAIYTYFAQVAKMLGSKRGDLSVYGMSVRYPFSAKAVATLSNRLPKNTVEIHTSMADILNVGNGDVVLVERFPCLGFMSVRPQKVKVTADPMCKYTIRVSGNSLGSMGLDFDGDVIYLASFHTPEAKELLRKEWTNPDEVCYNIIKKYNVQKGHPKLESHTMDDYEICKFKTLTVDEHAAIIEEVSGVKAYTGPVIAFLYNLMRIIENSDLKGKKSTLVGLEEFFTIVGESVFDLKHGIESPHKIFVDAICTGDINKLVENGFDRGTSTIICNTIKKKAAEIGVKNLKAYHERAKQLGGNIVSRIVRMQNRIYFASRAILEGSDLLECLKQPVVDIPSKMLSWTLNNRMAQTKTPLEERIEERNINKQLASKTFRECCSLLFKKIDSMFGVKNIKTSEV